MPKFTPLKGFRDFYPEEMAVRQYIANTWRRAAQLHGYVEYDGPPLEPLELYTQKSGDEIVSQLYDFVDKGGRSVALRPEMTPTVARMVAARWQSLSKPVRWFSIPQLFRYERPQAGRLREHFQFNVDIFGESGPQAEAELLAIVIRSLKDLGLTEHDVEIRLSDRELLNRHLSKIGVREAQFGDVYAVLDKLDRTDRDLSFANLIKAGLSEACIDRLFDLIDQMRGVKTPEEFMALSDGDDPLQMMFYHLYCILGSGHRSWVTIDPAIVRGLGYYTGTVFEVFDRQRKYRAICGGGRYDRLLGDLGGVNAPAAGFGWGDVVIAEVLREMNKLPAPQAPAEVVIAVEGHEGIENSGLFAAHLRDRGVRVLSVGSGQFGRYGGSGPQSRGIRFGFKVSPEDTLVCDLEMGRQWRVKGGSVFLNFLWHELNRESDRDWSSVVRKLASARHTG